MIYLFWIIMAYLLWCLIFGAYAYEMVERYDVPYKQTELDSKTMKIKEGVAFCSLRL